MSVCECVGGDRVCVCVGGGGGRGEEINDYIDCMKTNKKSVIIQTVRKQTKSHPKLVNTKVNNPANIFLDYLISIYSYHYKK